MRNYPLMPFEYKHHRSVEQQHAVVNYQEKNGSHARFLAAYASGSGSISFRVVDEAGEGVSGEKYTAEDVQHYVDATSRFAHYQVFQEGKDQFVIHAPVDRINDNTLWLEGGEYRYTCNKDIDKNYQAAYDFTKLVVIPKECGAPDYHVIDVKNIGMRGAMAYYLINEERILAQRKDSAFNQEHLLRALQESAPVAQLKSGMDLVSLDAAYTMLVEAAANAEMFVRIDDSFKKTNGYDLLAFTEIEKQILLYSAEKNATPEAFASTKEALCELLENNCIKIYDHYVDNITSGPLKPEYNKVPLAPEGFQP